MDQAVKISRGGERFWVRDIRTLEPNVFVGVVASDLTNSVLSKGEKIAFVAAEVVQVGVHHDKEQAT